MSEREALLKAVCAAPEDDLPRLVFADWCDENGEPERAEFIRVQCELAKRQANSPIDYAYCAAGGSDKTSCPTCNLKQRECDLLDDLAPRLFPDAVKVNRHWATDRNWGELPWAVPCLGDGSSPAEYLFRRGFVSEVRCRLAAWIGGECGRCGGHGRYIDYPEDEQPICQDCRGAGHIISIGQMVVADHPVQVVTATDKEPLGFAPPGGTRNPPWRWLRDDGSGGRAMVPDAVFHLMPVAEGVDRESAHWGRFFDTRDAAFAALNTALIQWARDRQPAIITS